MDKRIKYSLKQKLSAVRGIIDGRESCLSAAIRIGCNKSMIQRWLRLYKSHGAKGLTIRTGRYDGAFKLRVIRYLLKNNVSLIQAAAIFAVPSHSVVCKWLKIYQNCGAGGLLKETRSRKATSIDRKKVTKRKIDKSKSPEEMIAALQKELEYLRAENAFLKKLEALTQQEEASQAKSKRQKPSKS